jgi:hypothetical protein
VLDRLEPSVDALVTQVDSHSNHKTPEINLAGKYCVIDADGNEHTVDSVDAASGLFYKGPCDNGAGG